MNYQVILPSSGSLEALLQSDRHCAFAPIIIEFINDFSNFILSNGSYQEFPEIMALAFWLRTSHIKQLAASYQKSREGKIMLPRGVVFHISPANVDTIFIYSWFLSMLVGNANIIRISNRANKQLEMILNVLNTILDKNKYKALSQQFLIIKYAHDDQITEYLSSLCNVRVIWGGDDTINKIRSIHLPPFASEICFANKFSLAIVKSSQFINLANKTTLLEKFYNDVYVFFQSACSSPRLIVWVGTPQETKSASTEFWQIFSDVVKTKNLTIDDAALMEKFVTECSLSIERSAHVVKMESNIISRVKFSSLHDIELQKHCGNGLFYEVDTDQLSDLAAIIQTHNQTLASYGFSRDELKSNLLRPGIKGIDRIVDFGKALEFSPVWDGYDLLRKFEREVTLDISH